MNKKFHILFSALSVDSSESALGAEFFLTKSEWYDIMDVQTEIRRMISALHKLLDLKHRSGVNLLLRQGDFMKIKNNSNQQVRCVVDTNINILILPYETREININKAEVSILLEHTYESS